MGVSPYYWLSAFSKNGYRLSEEWLSAIGFQQEWLSAFGYRLSAKREVRLIKSLWLTADG